MRHPILIYINLGPTGTQRGEPTLSKTRMNEHLKEMVTNKEIGAFGSTSHAKPSWLELVSMKKNYQNDQNISSWTGPEEIHSLKSSPAIIFEVTQQTMTRHLEESTLLTSRKQLYILEAKAWSKGIYPWSIHSQSSSNRLSSRKSSRHYRNWEGAFS